MTLRFCRRFVGKATFSLLAVATFGTIMTATAIAQPLYGPTPASSIEVVQMPAGRIAALAAAHGASVSAITLFIYHDATGDGNPYGMHPNMRQVPPGPSSCTASTTVTVAGHAITLSATAPTCLEAVNNLLTEVNSLLNQP